MRPTLIFVLLFVLLDACQKDKAVKSFPPKEDGKKDTIKTLYDKVIDYQVQFIRKTQLPNGAMRDVEASNSRVCGYFSSSACRALLKAPTTENIEAVKKYMVWYMNHLNESTNPYKGGAEIPGSIYDYYYGTADSTKGEYDSIDSYAATFLTLASELAALSPEYRTWLSSFTPQLSLVANAMEACLDTDDNDVPTTFGPDTNDGLSVDSYVHGAKYLMDNTEVNQGLKALIWLEENIIHGGKKSHYQTLLNNNTAAIESQLWRSNRYNWVDDGSKGSSISKWSVFYPDATCQIFPGMFGVVDPTSERANIMYTLFNKNYPDWSTGASYTTYPWAITCYAAAIINDKVRVDTYLRHILTFNEAGQQKPYWYNAEAAFVILAADKMKHQGAMQEYSPMPITEISDNSGNLVLGKTATASASFNSEALAIDGDTLTRWSTVAGDNQWYKVNLGKVFTISRYIFIGKALMHPTMQYRFLPMI